MTHKTDKNLVTVVMVSYHTGPILDQAIDAVLASTSPVELILVNNGNPKEVEVALAARAKTEPRLKFITGHGNIGFSRACNKGAMAGKGAYILFLNPDSVLPKDAIKRLLDHAAHLAHPFMIGARLLDGNGKDQRGSRRKLLTPRSALVEALHLYKWFPEERLNDHEQPIPKDLTPVPAISGAFMFVPRQDFIHVHGFDEGYFLHVEDLDLCLRFRRAKGEIYFAPDIIVTHLGGTSKATNLFLEKNKAKGFVRYFHENFTHEYAQPVLWLLYLAIWTRFVLKIAIPKLREEIDHFSITKNR